MDTESALLTLLADLQMDKMMLRHRAAEAEAENARLRGELEALKPAEKAPDEPGLQAPPATG